MRSGRAGLVVAVAGIVVASASVAAVAPDASWTSFGHDQAVGAFTPAPASTTKVKSFALAWQATLDGGITASPLAAPVPGRGLVVFAATSKGNAPDRRGVAAEGRLLAYDVASPASAPAAFDPVPGQDNLGGIWGWGGVSVSDAGDLYIGVGNAEPDVDDGFSDSMVELTSDLSEVVSSDRPAGAVPGEDTDLGAAPVLFHPRGCPPLLAANSKSGDLLVWRQGRLARGEAARIPLSDGVDAFVGAPSWSRRTQMLYDAGVTEQRAGSRQVGTMALAVNAKCGFIPKWFVATGIGAVPEPLVAGDLVASTGGFGGGFIVSRAATGVTVWRFPTAAAAIAPMIEASGVLVGGDMSGRLYAFRPR